MLKIINVHDLKEKIDKNENIRLIDCREQFEWDNERIEGAELVPMSTFHEKYDSTLVDKDAEIIMQCRSGARSRDMGNFLIEQGFTNVSNLEGGIIAWKKADFPIIKSDS